MCKYHISLWNSSLITSFQPYSPSSLNNSVIVDALSDSQCFQKHVFPVASDTGEFRIDCLACRKSVHVVEWLRPQEIALVVEELPSRANVTYSSYKEQKEQYVYSKRSGRCVAKAHFGSRNFKGVSDFTLSLMLYSLQYIKCGGALD
jgi:hypothetical protein